nr:helix-turn-helix domain-containing protein [uncultured Lachnoclostridium sp.]
MDKILKVKDIQNHLGISKTRAYELIRLKAFPKIKIGHRYYIPQNEYEEWLKKNTKNQILL